MVRKAKAGHVTGGRVFGYDNVRTEAGHVERRVNEAEADVVRRIFHFSAEGHGLAGCTNHLLRWGLSPVTTAPAQDTHRHLTHAWYRSLSHRPAHSAGDWLGTEAPIISCHQNIITTAKGHGINSHPHTLRL